MDETVARAARRVVAVLATIAIVGLSGCEPAPVVPTPGRVDARRPLTVAVFGDSLTPITDYVFQGQRSGYVVTEHTGGGSHMCGVGDEADTGDDRNWVGIQRQIEAGVDAVVVQYQGWQNYTLACGGRMDDFPYATYRTTDPGKKWRVYLDEIARQVRDAGDRTHVFVVVSIPSPADMPQWSTPQRITDEGTRAVAARHPEQISVVSARHLFARDGRWTEMAPCLAQEVARGLCGPSADPRQPTGWVRLRGDDRIHLACPGTAVMVCPRPSPAGMRYRLVLFAALNRWFAARAEPPTTTAPGPPARAVSWAAGGVAPAGSR